MRIPRQPDGPAPAGADDLRARRSHLVDRLRTLAYWQRLVQARVDLVVAGLLYRAPAAPSTAWTAPVAASGPTSGDPGVEYLHALSAPPEGLDVTLLIGCTPQEDGGPGAYLEQLRRTSLLLLGRRRQLEDELDAVTLALHDRLACDGAEDRHRARGTAAPLVGGPAA